MAQAARLNLRMQKELKLLLTDPPPGASFPNLSPDSDLAFFSLSSIDAQIKGPEETVYANGVFNVKIQIPERYPFQPPSVTFATPIYHPNIDTGGRICLDILNLPPKGAWQPSLNISTVLTSIGLLLSEPNPDDGLMCEASREFKYNRQAFDQKARSMTEKYARPGVGCGNGCIQSSSNPNMVVEVNSMENESEHDANEYAVSRKKICGSSRKLSLESSGPTQKRVDCGEGTEASNDQRLLTDSNNHMEVEGTENELKDTLQKLHSSQEKLCGNRRKLSLQPFAQHLKKQNSVKENVVPNPTSSRVPENLPVSSFASLMPLDADCPREEHQGCQDSKIIEEKLHGLCQKLPLRPLENTSDCSKEKMILTPQLLPSETSANSLDEAISEASAHNHVKLQPQKDYKDKVENACPDLGQRKLGLVRRNLSLGLRGSSGMQEKDNKENVHLLHKKPLFHARASLALSRSTAGKKEDCESGPGKSNKYGRGQKPSMVGAAQLRESDDNHMRQQECGWDQKQHFDQDHNDTIASEIKKQEAEESQLSEAVIVLDSEDSEDEKCVPLRSKPPLARKRLGKWKLRA
ncbi:hypothetical protein UlMin_022270 [Ulmus minor]